MLAAAMLVAAASLEPVGSGAGSRSVATRRAGMTLAEAEGEVEALFAASSDDLRHAVRDLVKQRQRLGEPGSPSAPPPAELPFPDDVEKQARTMILEGRAPPSAWWPVIRSLAFELEPLESLSPLAGLTALQHLDLRGTQVRDVGPLARLTALQYLNLWRTQVRDLAPLAGLTALRHLDLWSTPVSDVGPLAGLTALQYLNLWRTRVSDISPLAGLTALQELDLRGTEVSDVFPLAGLTALQYLDLRGTQVSEIPPALAARLKRGPFR